MLQRLAFVLCLALAGAVPAAAQEFGVAELRAGVMAHSVDEPGPNGAPLNLTRIEDITFEALFTSPDVAAFHWIGRPRPSVGATVNLAGRESLVRLGLTWHVPLGDSPVFVEGTFGGALHNGALNGATPPSRNLGCSLMFYESAGLGVNVSDSMTMMLALEHSSNANLCSDNRGLTNVGVKIGYKF